MVKIRTSPQTKLNFREIKSNLNNTIGETLNAKRNQQRNSDNNNNNKDNNNKDNNNNKGV